MGWIIGALFVILMVESMTAGVALFFAVRVGAEKIVWTPTEERTLAGALQFAFFVVTFAGFLFSLPCLCYALHKRHSDWLFPYLVWRLILIVLVMAMAIYLLVQRSGSESGPPTVLVPAGLEVVLGGLFFWLAYLALRRFARCRISTVQRLLDS